MGVRVDEAEEHEGLDVAELGSPAYNDSAGVTAEFNRNLLRRLNALLDAGFDPQQILAEILTRTEVKSFEIAQPSLHDIFVRIAGTEAMEAADA